MPRRNLGAMRARAARSLLALDRAEEARALLEPSLVALEEDLAADPGNMFLQITVGELATRLGEALVAQAQGATSNDRDRLRLEARGVLARAIEITRPLVENGTLTGSDAATLDQARDALSSCSAGI
jgi:hypothetical protein